MADRVADTLSGHMRPMHEALDRMRKAFEAGRGVRLTWRELEAMNRSVMGEWWSEDNPLDTDTPEDDL